MLGRGRGKGPNHRHTEDTPTSLRRLAREKARAQPAGAETGAAPREDRRRGPPPATAPARPVEEAIRDRWQRKGKRPVQDLDLNRIARRV
jgi:hypothetical protein